MSTSTAASGLLHTLRKEIFWVLSPLSSSGTKNKWLELVRCWIRGGNGGIRGGQILHRGFLLNANDSRKSIINDSVTGTNGIDRENCLLTYQCLHYCQEKSLRFQHNLGPWLEVHLPL
jgi:hypothetical protein